MSKMTLAEKSRVRNIPCYGADFGDKQSTKTRPEVTKSNGGYLILLTLGILGIFRYKKSEVNIQINTEA